jgi:putative oxidoreductase
MKGQTLKQEKAREGGTLEVQAGGSPAVEPAVQGRVDGVTAARDGGAGPAASAAVPSGAAVPSVRRLGAALAVLRAVVGLVFVVHGAQKLFVFGLSGVAGAFAGMGVPLAALAGPVVAFVEFLGGIAVLLGVFTRPAAAALAVVMLGAIVFVHAAGGFFVPEGVEFVLTLLAASTALVVLGPGVYSLEAVLARRRASAR